MHRRLGYRRNCSYIHGIRNKGYEGQFKECRPNIGWWCGFIYCHVCLLTCIGGIGYLKYSSYIQANEKGYDNKGI